MRNLLILSLLVGVCWARSDALFHISDLTKDSPLLDLIGDLPLRDLPYGPDLDVKLTPFIQFLKTVLPKPLPIRYHLIFRKRLNELQEGDVIVITSSWGLQTYAIVSGSEKAICFVNRRGQPVLDDLALLKVSEMRLGEVDIMQLSTANSFTIVKQEDKSTTLSRAWNLLRYQRKWSFFEFNSEHFASMALIDKSESHQLIQLQKYMMKHLITGGLTVAFTEEGSKVIKKLISSVTQQGAEKVIKETTEETLSTLAKLTKGAKAGAKAGLWPCLLVEGVFFSHKWQQLHSQKENKEISEEQYKRQVVIDAAASGGSVAGGIAGAAIGSAVFPVVGTFVGSVVGGVLGSMVGSNVGETVGGKLLYGAE